MVQVIHLILIHLLSGTDSNGKISYEMVFGASNIIGDIKDAIDNAFEEIERITLKSLNEQGK